MQFDKYAHHNGDVPPSSRQRADVAMDAPSLLPLFDELPEIVYTKSDPSYDALSAVFNPALPSKPLAVVRARNEDDICSVVRLSKSAGIPLRIRSGGCDMTGRNLIGVETGVLLDLRSLSSVSIAEDKASAIVGAGILTRDLASTITAAGLFTPIGWHPMVGYAGWAMGGGYGMFSSAYGLGVDQILGARLVTADGSIIDVDETSHPDLLWAIRGAGNGIWGVVTQLKIKIYPQPKLLIGTLQYQKEDWPLVMMDWAERFEANLPIEFAGDIYLRNPTIDRPEMTFFFAWCAKPGEDIELGYEFLDRMRSLPGSATERISEVDLASFLRSIPSAQSAPVHLRGVITTGLTKAVASVLNRQWNEPRPLYMGIPSHFAHGQAVQPNPKACFPLRYPHRLFPLVCSHPDMLKDKYFESAVTAMADRVVRELKDTTDVLEGVSYGSLIPAIDTEITATFGTEALNRLRALKALYDPTGLFSGGYPALDRTT